MNVAKSWGIFFVLVGLGVMPVIDNAFSVRADEALVKTQVFESAIVFENPFHFFEYRLEDTVPGTHVKATVLLRNDTKNSFQLEKVVPSCTCTTANVPARSVEPTETVRMDFVMRVDQRPKATYQNFDVSVRTTGSCDEVRLRFIAKLRGVVAFSQKDYVFSISSDGAEKSLILPFTVSDDVKPEELGVRIEGGISSYSCKIAQSKSGPYVALSIPSGLGIVDTLGEVVLAAGDKRIANALCSIRSERLVEIMPGRLVFFPSERGDGSREAVAILRLRGGLAKSPESLGSVKAAVSTGESVLDVSWKQIATGTFRVKIFVPPEMLLEKSGQVEFEIRVNSEDIALTSPFSITN